MREQLATAAPLTARQHAPQVHLQSPHLQRATRHRQVLGKHRSPPANAARRRSRPLRVASARTETGALRGGTGPPGRPRRRRAHHPKHPNREQCHRRARRSAWRNKPKDPPRPKCSSSPLCRNSNTPRALLTTRGATEHRRTEQEAARRLRRPLGPQTQERPYPRPRHASEGTPKRAPRALLCALATASKARGATALQRRGAAPRGHTLIPSRSQAT